MTVAELFEHFLSRAPWVNRSATPDAIEAGDPNREVRRIGVGWSACAPNLRAAAADGCDLFITHEPCFCEFWEPDLRFRDTDWGELRTRILEENGMALFALHDTWDRFPRWGIRDSWVAHLGFSEDDVIARRDYGASDQLLGLYRVGRTTVDGFARHVAERVRELGMDGVIVMGDGAHPVERVAIGVGCGIPEQQMLDLGADVLVQVFDRAFQTFSRLPLLDLGANLIVLEHGVTEMPGMASMARYINEVFPDLTATFYRHEADSRVVTA